MKSLGFLVWLCCLAYRAAAAPLSKGDEIELTRDVPLYFNGTSLVRVGARGERFTVIVTQPEQRRVYISARDGIGNEIALSVIDDAVKIARPATTPSATGKKSTKLQDEQARMAVAIMSARLTPLSRAQAIKRYEGKTESEEAVVRALRFWVQTQNPDGSWGQDDKPGMTGLALLAFVGHGETGDSPEFGPTIRVAIQWVINNAQNFNGRLSTEASFSPLGVYSHAILTDALAEFYLLTKDERVARLIQNAVDYIILGQAPDGSWSFSYSKSLGETFVTGWQMQALYAARLTGLPFNRSANKRVEDSIKLGRIYLARLLRNKADGTTANPGEGRFTPQDIYSRNGIAAFCGYLLGDPQNRTLIRESMERAEKPPSQVSYKRGEPDLYTWFFPAQASIYFGRSPRVIWNRLFQTEILKNQSPDGSWPPLTTSISKGTPRDSNPVWPSRTDLQIDPGVDGRLFRTGLCTLMLEIYYRYAL